MSINMRRKEAVMVRISGRNVVPYESQREKIRANPPKCVFAPLLNRKLKAKPQRNAIYLRICRTSGAVSVLGVVRSQMCGKRGEM